MHYYKNTPLQSLLLTLVWYTDHGVHCESLPLHSLRNKGMHPFFSPTGLHTLYSALKLLFYIFKKITNGAR